MNRERSHRRWDKKTHAHACALGLVLTTSAGGTMPSSIESIEKQLCVRMSFARIEQKSK